jgi:hypothetical protein
MPNGMDFNVDRRRKSLHIKTMPHPWCNILELRPSLLQKKYEPMKDHSFAPVAARFFGGLMFVGGRIRELPSPTEA